MKKQILFFGIFALFFVFAVQAANVQSQDINSADELKSYIVVVETKNYTKVMSVLNNETQNNVGIQQISSISQPKAISMLSDLKKKPNQQIKQLDIIHGFAAKMSARKAEDLRQQGYKVYLDRVFHILLQNSTIQVGANDAWLMMNTSGSNLTGNGSKIAIIDTGVDYTHPDLGNCTTSCNNTDCNWSNCSKVDDGYNFVDNNNNSMDDNGHGTHCAGIAAADNGSGNGVKGVAPNAKLLAYKVCNKDGECQTSNIILAIQRAIKYNATVISISLGSNEIQAKGTIVNPDETLQEAI
ncbi:S8 family serine peptidase, partial [archaeon]|nr:S8 family serine peptidase [archaeon]